MQEKKLTSMQRLDTSSTDISIIDYNCWHPDAQGIKLLVLQENVNLISCRKSITNKIIIHEPCVEGAKCAELKDLLFNRWFFSFWKSTKTKLTDILFSQPKFKQIC